MHQMPLESSFGIIPFQIINDSLHVLLIKLCSGNHWSFPKGHQEPNESPLETAQRELKEETALVIASFIDLPPFVENYFIEKKEGKVQKTVTYFPAFVEGVLSIQTEEVLDYQWTPLEKAEALASYPETQKICRQLLQLLPKG